MSSYAPFPVEFAGKQEMQDKLASENPDEWKFLPYGRDEKLKRPWVKPGTPGLLHRIGGIEKAVGTGNLDYGAENHQKMTEIRRDKVANIAVPDQIVELGETSGKLAIVGWGSTFGPIHQAVRRARARGLDVAHIHIRHIWPMPANLGALLKGYERIVVPEMNTGQLKTVLRDQFLVDAKPLNKVSGQPFLISEIEAAIDAALAALS
jgi:2-oxoglutarate ferredoxin oxidoreductase subunit alpha